MKLNKKLFPNMELVDSWDPETLYSFKACHIPTPSSILSDTINNHVKIKNEA